MLCRYGHSVSITWGVLPVLQNSTLLDLDIGIGLYTPTVLAVVVVSVVFSGSTMPRLRIQLGTDIRLR